MRIFQRFKKKKGFYLFCCLSFLLLGNGGCENGADDFRLGAEELSPENIFTRGSFEKDAFITEWSVPKDSLIQLPLDTAFVYNFIVDWGDDSDLQQYTNRNLLTACHRYDRSGVYRVRILGTCETWRWINNNTTKKYLTRVVQWGNVHFKSLGLSFADCVNLSAIPPGIPNVESYGSAFLRCTSLTSLPEGLFANCYMAKNFTSTFAECSNLRVVPPGLFQDCVAAEYFTQTFMSSGLLFLPEGMFKNCRNVISFALTFWKCSGLAELPPDLFQDCEQVITFMRTFSNCSNLKYVPAGLFDKNKRVTSFSNTFAGCSSLSGYTPNTDGVELWERQEPDYTKVGTGAGCFRNCTGLTNYAAIPAEWK